MRSVNSSNSLVIMEMKTEIRTVPSEEVIPKKCCNDKTRRLFIGIGIILILLASTLVVKYGFFSQIATFLHFVKELGWWGNFIICLCFIVISFPIILGAYLPLTLGAGAIYGVLMGTLTVSLGSTVGACIAFWICRAFTRKWLEETLKKRKEFRYFLAMMQGKDQKFVTVLARLSPIPFGLQNGFFALTDISFRDFFLSTWIGLLPFQVVWTHLGTTLRNLSMISSGEMQLTMWQQLSLGLQVVMTILLVGYFWYLSRKLNVKEEDTTGPELDLEKGHLSVITT